MEKQTYESVWDALEDTPDMAENMKIRSVLMIALQEHVKGWDLSQTEAAHRLGVTQPHLNDLLRGGSISSVWMLWSTCSIVQG